jgi:hypothetical protein
MTQVTPSADSIAEAARRQRLETYLKAEDDRARWDEYAKAKSTAATFINLGGLLGIVVGILAGVQIFGGAHPIAFVAGGILGGLAGLVLGAIIGLSEAMTASRILDQFEAELIRRDRTQKAHVQEIRTMTEDALKHRGDQIIAGDYATIINNATVIGDVVKNIQITNPDLSDAIRILAGAVEESGSKNAAEAFEDLVTEIDGARKPSRLRAFWDQLVRFLPDTAKIAGAAATISKLF